MNSLFTICLFKINIDKLVEKTKNIMFYNVYLISKNEEIKKLTKTNSEILIPIIAIN